MEQGVGMGRPGHLANERRIVGGSDVVSGFMKSATAWEACWPCVFIIVGPAPIKW